MEKEKIKRKHSTEINNVQFIISWLVASVLVWVIIFVLGMIALLALIMLSAMFLDQFVMLLVGNLNAMICYGGLIGLSIGIVEKPIIQHILHADVQYWLRYSALGGVIGIIFAFLLHSFAPNTLDEIDGVINSGVIDALIVGIVLTGVSLGQWFQLRRFVRDAWLWILANAMGGITFVTLFLQTESPDASPMTIVLFTILSVFSLAALTGVPLLWLFKNRRIPQKRQHDAAEDSAPFFEQPSQSDDSNSHLLEQDHLDCMTTGS